MLSASTLDYLAKAVIPMRLSCLTHEGWPIVISLWFIVRDGNLYCATQETAKIISYLRKSPQCGFEIAGDQPPYCGVRGRARAEILPELGPEILNRLLNRYLGSTSNQLSETLLSKEETEVAIRLVPVSISTWNFSTRMIDSIEVIPDKPCPA